MESPGRFLRRGQQTAEALVQPGAVFCEASSQNHRECSRVGGSGRSLAVFFGFGGFVAFGRELAGGHLAVGFLEQDLDFVFCLFELLLALPLKADAFLKDFQRLVLGQVAGFELLDDLFQAVQRGFENGFGHAPSCQVRF